MSASTTLLLNATYEPLRVIPWQRAITMVFLDKVEVLRSYDRAIHTVSAAVPTPAVVKLHSFVRRHRVRIAFSRRNLFLRDGHRCQYCGDVFPAAELTTDHVVPRSSGGRTIWENVVTACGPCNRKKANRTPAQARMHLYRQPVMPQVLPPLGVRIGGEPPEAWREFLVDGGEVVAAS